jgi:hypothetical protein
VPEAPAAYHEYCAACALPRPSKIMPKAPAVMPSAV